MRQIWGFQLYVLVGCLGLFAGAGAALAAAPDGVGALDLDVRANSTAAVCRTLADGWEAGQGAPSSVRVGERAVPVTIAGPMEADATAALQAFLDAAPPSGVAFLPPGWRASRRDVVVVRVAGLQLCAYGAFLDAADERRAALEIAVDGVGVFGLSMNGPASSVADWPERWRVSEAQGLPSKYPDGDSNSFGWESNHVVVRNVRDVILRDVVTYGGRRGGVRLYGSRNVLVEGGCFSRSFSDGIHIVHGARNVTVRGNEVIETGDDCISVVTYDRDKHPETVSSVLIEGNLCHGSRARGLTVIGGDAVTIRNNRIVDTLVSAVLIHPSDEYNTYPVNDVTVSGNAIDGAGLRRDDCGNCGDIVVNDSFWRPARNVTISDNEIAPPRARGAPIRPGPTCPAP